jgi:hypothetical protein
MNPDKMLSSGFNTNQVIGILGEVASTVVIAGTLQTDATPIKSEINILTSGTGGARLPRPTHAGQEIYIFNNSGATATIYPSSGGKINGGSADAGVSLLTTYATTLRAVNNLDWFEFSNRLVIATGDAADVEGPASATASAAALFDGTTGKLLKDSKVLLTVPASAATLTLGSGKTVAISHSLTLAGTDSTTMTFPSTTATIARTDAAQTFTGAQTFGSPTRENMANALTAVGTDRDTSLALTAQWNNITSAASGTGVTLPAAVAGSVIGINHAGANAIQVYGAGSDTIDGVAAATGVPLTNAKRALFICFAAPAWISAQLGVVSA